MDIMEIIDMMEETIEKAPVVPLSGKILVDKDDIMDYIQEMRLVYPEELKEAKWLKGERQRILSEAEAKAEATVKNAEEEAVRMVDENEITRQAYEQANSVVAEAQNRQAEIQTSLDQYVNDRLSELEHGLDSLIREVQQEKANYNNQ